MTAGPHTVLVYDYVADVMERRAPHRDAHLAWIREWVDGGLLLSAGALADPPTGALFVFGGDVLGRDVAARRVLPWNVVAAAS